MVTHGLHWLPDVDHVIVLADGGVSESGTYNDLMTHDGPFAKLVRTYLLMDEEDDDEVDGESEYKIILNCPTPRVEGCNPMISVTP